MDREGLQKKEEEEELQEAPPDWSEGVGGDYNFDEVVAEFRARLRTLQFETEGGVGGEASKLLDRQGSAQQKVEESSSVKKKDSSESKEEIEGGGVEDVEIVENNSGVRNEDGESVGVEVNPNANDNDNDIVEIPREISAEVTGSFAESEGDLAELLEDMEDLIGDIPEVKVEQSAGVEENSIVSKEVEQSAGVEENSISNIVMKVAVSAGGEGNSNNNATVNENEKGLQAMSVKDDANNVLAGNQTGQGNLVQVDEVDCTGQRNNEAESDSDIEEIQVVMNSSGQNSTANEVKPESVMDVGKDCRADFEPEIEDDDEITILSVTGAKSSNQVDKTASVINKEKATNKERQETEVNILEYGFDEEIIIETDGVITEHSVGNAATATAADPVLPSTSDETVPIYAVDSSSSNLLMDELGEDPNNSSLQKDCEKSVPDKHRMSCFNCTGGHNLKDCPKKRNYKLINKRKKEFRESSGNRGNLPNVRYHDAARLNEMEIPIHEKYASVKPGQISVQLRKTLGLEDYQLPSHIYGMRMHGYPPGWLEAAVAPEEPKQGLKIYESIAQSAQSRPVVKPQANQPRVLRWDLLPDFPGFTSPVPKGYLDEGHLYHGGLALFSESHSINNVMREWNRKEAARCSVTPLVSNSNPINNQRTSSSASNYSRPEYREYSCPGGSQTPLGPPVSPTSSRVLQEPEIPWYHGITDNNPAPVVQTSSTTQLYLRQETSQWVRDPYGRLSIHPDITSVNQFNGCRNYRITEELERRERDTRKENERKKSAETGQVKVENWDADGAGRYSPASPSILCAEEVPNPRKTKRTKKLLSTKIVPEADVIVLESDDDDENGNIPRPSNHGPAPRDSPISTNAPGATHSRSGDAPTSSNVSVLSHLTGPSSLLASSSNSPHGQRQSCVPPAPTHPPQPAEPEVIELEYSDDESPPAKKIKMGKTLYPK